MENYTVICTNCDFRGTDEDLIKAIEFKENKDSNLEYLTLREFDKVKSAHS